MNKYINIETKQSLFDLSLQEYGSVEGLFLLMEDNNIASVNDNLNNGDALSIKSEAVNRGVVDYYEERGIGVRLSVEFVPVVVTRAFSSGFSLGFS